MSRINDALDHLLERDLISAEDHGYGMGFKDGRAEMRDEMRDELEALRAEVSQGDRKQWIGWQPIETVPDSGRDVLVAWNDGEVEMMAASTARDYVEQDVDYVEGGGGRLILWTLIPEAPKTTE